MQRADGWPGLRAAYRLPQRANGLDHDLAYRGLANGALDVIDLYRTDAEHPYYGLRVLDDSRHYFPEYEAVYLYRTIGRASCRERVCRDVSVLVAAVYLKKQKRT